MTILETTSNQLFRVVAFDLADMPQVFAGVPVKRSKGGVFTDRAMAKQQLVRKAGCRVVVGPPQCA